MLPDTLEELSSHGFGLRKQRLNDGFFLEFLWLEDFAILNQPLCEVWSQLETYSTAGYLSEIAVSRKEWSSDSYCAKASCNKPTRQLIITPISRLKTQDSLAFAHAQVRGKAKLKRLSKATKTPTFRGVKKHDSGTTRRCASTLLCGHRFHVNCTPSTDCWDAKYSSQEAMSGPVV